MPLSRQRLVALLIIAGLAALLRFWRLNTLPPGQHYDEAFNALHALRIARGEELPVYVADEFGEEPMHIYLIALLFKIVGPTPLGGRIVSAAIGTVTVILVYFLAAELFHHLGRKDAERLSLLASLFPAAWYWPFHYNRIGMEPSTVPMVGTAAMLFIWRTIRTGQKRDAILAGAFTALGMYTYPAGRVIPLVALIVAAYQLAFARKTIQRFAPNLALAVFVAALVFLPLGSFYVQNPQWFLLRTWQTTEVTLGSHHPLASVGQGFGNTLLGFFWRGDENWRQNLSGRPMFDLVQFVFFIVGGAICLRRIRHSPYWLLLGWAGAGLLPTVLTEYAPHFGRALGATPPLAIIASLGLWTAGKQLARWRPNLRFAPAALAGVAMAFSTGLALNDYFNRWANAPELFIAFNVGLRAVGEYAAKLPPDQSIYLTPVPNDWYTLEYAVGGHKDRLRSFNGRECLVFPAHTDQPTHQLVIVQPGEDERSLLRLESIFPNGATVWKTHNRELTYALDYLVPAGETALFRPQFLRRAAFAGGIELLGYDLNERTARPGEQLNLSLWWKAATHIATDYTVFVHLASQPDRGAGTKLWAQHDTRPCDESYLTTRWSPDEIVWDDYRLYLPQDLPPGNYNIEIGLYDLANNQRVNVTTPSSTAESDEGNSLILTAITVGAP